MTLFTITLMFCLKLSAPPNQSLIIFEGESVNKYDKLIKAIVKVESNNGKHVYNEFEGAVGWFQIRQCRIDTYNHLTGLNYALNDCYDYEIGRKVFLYFTKDRSYEVIARAWCSGENGTKKASDSYYAKIKKLL